MKSPNRKSSRAGQSLVEFAVVALVLYMLLAAILTFGHALYVAQGLQSAADVAAKEISRTPLAVGVASLDDDGTGTDALSSTNVRSQIYDDAFLVIDLDDFYDNFVPSDGTEANIFVHLVPQLPLLNQQLVPLMIVDRPTINGAQRQLLRYPGALLTRGAAAVHPTGGTYDSWVSTNLTVRIPLIDNRDAAGTETIQWVDVVEEIESATNPNPFDINSAQRGIVALRMNYPFQSASMSSFQENAAGPLEPTIGNPNVANDDGVVETNVIPGGGTLLAQPLESGGVYVGTYGGDYGLGAQGALGETVRPYRRVISAQAIYRREIFQ